MNKQELIEEYLKGKLKGGELDAFESRLGDPVFASEVEDQRLAHDLIFYRGLLDTKARLAAIRQRKESARLKWQKLKWFFGGLALVGTLCTVAFVSLNKNTKESPGSVQTEPSVAAAGPQDTSKASGSAGKIKLQQKPDPWKENTIASKNIPMVPEMDSVPMPGNSTVTESLLKEVEQPAIPSVAPLQKTLTSVNPCQGVVIQAVLRSEKSCSNAYTGSLSVLGVSGGKEPYTYLLSQSGIVGTETKLNYFDHLGEGSYNLVIMDADGCRQELKVTIESKLCDPVRKDIFAPDYEDGWSYPAKPGSSFVIRIYDSGGQQIFQTRVSNGVPASWDGRKNDGSPVSTGAYIYQIEYADGSVEQGSVTIAR